MLENSDQMSSFRIRPRFKQVMAGTATELEKQIAGSFKKEEQFTTTHTQGNIYIKIHPKNQHMWSPQLHLSFEQDEDQAIIRGLYGPNPTLWAIFFFGYVALGLSACFFGMWGLSKWSLGMDASVLWTLPVFAAIATGMYLSAQAGQKLGAQQMFDIHHCYEQAIDEKVAVH